MDTPGLAVDKWSYVAVTYDGTTGTMKVYIDKVEIKTETITPMPLKVSNRLRSGSLDGSLARFAGDIACVQLFDSALTPEQLAEKESCSLGIYIMYLTF